jgi:hypothetical protein
MNMHEYKFGDPIVVNSPRYGLIYGTYVGRGPTSGSLRGRIVYAEDAPDRVLVADNWDPHKVYAEKRSAVRFAS